MVEQASIDATAQIIRKRNRVRRSTQEDHGYHNCRNEDHCEDNGYDRSLTAFPLDISENLLFSSLGLRHHERPVRGRKHIRAIISLGRNTKQNEQLCPSCNLSG